MEIQTESLSTCMAVKIVEGATTIDLGLQTKHELENLIDTFQRAIKEMQEHIELHM